MFHGIIKSERKKQGLTQSVLAEKAGIRQATLSDFESGKRELGKGLLQKIMNILDINIDKKFE